LLIGLNPSVLEFMFDTTRMIANMVTTGAKKRSQTSRSSQPTAAAPSPTWSIGSKCLSTPSAWGLDGSSFPLKRSGKVSLSFYYDLTAATSEAQLGAILKLVPVSQLVMGLDFPLMPKSTFAPAIADIGRYPAFNKADLQSLSYGNAGRLYPALKARIEQSK